jgi:DNA-binding response OmpR family regulator
LSEEAASEQDVPSLESVVPSGTKAILLVEDEDSLREVTGEYLKNKRYNVLVASEGESAIAAATSCAKPIDLLLTDVLLPGGSGVQFGAVSCSRSL